MQKLNDLDAKVLRFIRDNPSCAVDFVESGLPNVDAVKSRVCFLKELELVKMDLEEIRDGALIRMIPLSTYTITETGKRELQNFEHSTKKYRRELWLKNAWIPILVSFVTTVATNYILPRLPLLIEWFRRILSRTFA